ncbi:serine hydrolase domain-containing protein [Gilvimarinus sp. F26214L]|uniref:serine hydrolase domain-containing protein n=1 Tax=Gilvimarinus sp. DZF01 TaxID=3461371 RepID=UPI0040461639
MDITIVVGLVSLVATGAHFWIADRLAIFRAIYPVEAQLSVMSGRCSAEAPEWMEVVLEKITRKGGSLSNQLVFMTSGGRLHHCENGWKNVPVLSPRVDQYTRFRYASLTKIFTADAVLQLVSEGKLQLDSKLIEFIPDLSPLKDPRVASITIEQLLRHQAGFDRFQTLDVMFAHGQKPWCPYDLQVLAKFTLDFAPGERHSYSNRGYCLLGQVIEGVTGSTYQDHIRKHYLDDESGIQFVHGPYMPDEVHYDFRNDDFYGETYHRFFDFEALAPVASLSGSAAALAVSVKRMLSRDRLNLLSAQVPQNCGRDRHEDCFGFALYPYSERGGTRVYLQKGLLPGAESLLMVDENGGVLVILSSGTALTGEQRKSLLSNIYRARVGGMTKHGSASQ